MGSELKKGQGRKNSLEAKCECADRILRRGGCDPLAHAARDHSVSHLSLPGHVRSRVLGARSSARSTARKWPLLHPENTLPRKLKENTKKSGSKMHARLLLLRCCAWEKKKARTNGSSKSIQGWWWLTKWWTARHWGARSAESAVDTRALARPCALLTNLYPPSPVIHYYE